MAEITKMWIADKMREIMKHKPIDKIRVTDKRAYSIRFYCMGAVGMTQEWVLTDNITSAETVVQMMFGSMPENLRKVLF